MYITEYRYDILTCII